MTAIYGALRIGVKSSRRTVEIGIPREPRTRPKKTGLARFSAIEGKTGNGYATGGGMK